MILFSLLFLCVHLLVYSYQDRRANQLFTFTLLAGISLGLLNLVKAAYLEGLVDLTVNANMIWGCDKLQEVILIWLPLAGFAAFLVFAALKKVPFSKMKCLKQNTNQKEEVEEVELKQFRIKAKSF